MRKPGNIKEEAAGFFYAAIFNQIHASVYYHISEYTLNTATGKYYFAGVYCGHRGPGGNLGLGRREAQEMAERLNRKHGYIREDAVCLNA